MSQSHKAKTQFISFESRLPNSDRIVIVVGIAKNGIPGAISARYVDGEWYSAVSSEKINFPSDKAHLWTEHPLIIKIPI